jgi:long-chain acyl-CoA synthetase
MDEGGRKGVKKTIPFDHIFDAFSASAERYGDKTSLVYLGTRFSYKRILGFARHFAASLSAHGVCPGDRVVLYLPNSVQWVIAWLGVLRAGAVAVPITPIYTDYDVSYIARDSGASFIICSDTNYGYVQRALPETQVETVIISKWTDLLPWWKRLFGWAFDKVPKGKIPKDGKTLSFARMVKSSPRAEALPSLKRDEKEYAEIIYTGGTTKHAKGVPISHGLYLESALEQIGVSESLFPATENVIVGSTPLFHILGQTCALSTLLVGGTLVVFPKVNLDAIFDAVERLKAKTLIGVPTLYRMILEHDRIDLYDLSSLRYCFNGGDVLPVDTNQRWRVKYGVPIYQGYERFHPEGRHALVSDGGCGIHG